jgi:predicted ester cyclase
MNLLIDNQQINKQIAQKWMDCITTGDIEAICRITNSNWVMHGIPIQIAKGPEGVRKLFASFGVIEQRWIINEMIAEGDKVVIQATNYCHQDNFLGIPSHGQKQIFTATFIHRIVNGEICETWRNADDLGRLLQLGARIVPMKVVREENKIREDLFARAMNVLQKTKE